MVRLIIYKTNFIIQTWNKATKIYLYQFDNCWKYVYSEFGWIYLPNTISNNGMHKMHFNWENYADGVHYYLTPEEWCK